MSYSRGPSSYSSARTISGRRERIKEIQDNVADLAELCRFNQVEPILTTVIPVRKNRDVFNSDAFEPYSVSDSLAKFNSWLRDFCVQNGYRLADFNRALADSNGFLPGELSIDNTHLNEAGSGRLRDAVLEAISGLDAQPSVER